MDSNSPFDTLLLNDKILRAIKDEGYTQPTPIQAAAIPEIMAGKDLLGTAQTGTGKTAAFSLPLLHTLSTNRPEGPRGLRALILTPTRELAQQVSASLNTYGRYLQLRSLVVVGGLSIGMQIRDLKRNPDILVATPGRLLDLLDRRAVRLDRVEMLVLDEADRMLDMGFVEDVKHIVSLTPENRQTLFFSATMSPSVTRLANEMLREPARVSASAADSVPVKIAQQVLFVDANNKNALLSDIVREKDTGLTLVFTKTKYKADRVARHLSTIGISSDAIHSDKTQRARQNILADFRDGRIQVLIATDIVARGIDVSGISHVINYEMPQDPESYVHRIGRTARAGSEGIAMSFCDAEDMSMLKTIERLTKVQLSVVDDHAYHSDEVAASKNRGSGNGSGRPGGQNRRRSSGRPFGRGRSSGAGRPAGNGGGYSAGRGDSAARGNGAERGERAGRGNSGGRFAGTGQPNGSGGAAGRPGRGRRQRSQRASW